MLLKLDPSSTVADLEDWRLRRGSLVPLPFDRITAHPCESCQHKESTDTKDDRIYDDLRLGAYSAVSHVPSLSYPCRA